MTYNNMERESEEVDSNLTDIVSIKNPNSPISEAYKTLRTNIKFSSVDKGLKTIAITSTGKGEGKSTVISNLAATMAQDNSRVLLVDCDLRRPTIHKRFYLSNLEGLSNVLTQQNSRDQVIQKTSIEGLDILTSGPKPPNPSEMLGSNAMKELLLEVAKDYDRVLIDAPPIGIVTDAAILTTMVEGVLFVVSAKGVAIEAAKHAKELLETVNANIVGVILNKVSVGTGRYSSYKYYQDYYEDEDQDSDTVFRRRGKKRRAKNK